MVLYAEQEVCQIRMLGDLGTKIEIQLLVTKKMILFNTRIYAF